MGVGASVRTYVAVGEGGKGVTVGSGALVGEGTRVAPDASAVNVATIAFCTATPVATGSDVDVVGRHATISATSKTNDR